MPASGHGVPDGVALALALAVLAGTLAAAVARPPYVSEAVAAAAGAVVLVIVGALGPSRAGDVLRELAPTVGFLAALLLIADGCRREGLFDALGEVMTRGSRGDPRRLLAFVFATAAGITAVLGLDATVVLLTPVVFATAARMRTGPKPHVYACSHLVNSASLLLPVSNLTNCSPSTPRNCRSLALPRSWRFRRSSRWASNGSCSGGSSRSISNARASAHPGRRGRHCRASRSP
jgi:hypothetical protein